MIILHWKWKKRENKNISNKIRFGHFHFLMVEWQHKFPIEVANVVKCIIIIISSSNSVEFQISISWKMIPMQVNTATHTCHPDMEFVFHFLVSIRSSYSTIVISVSVFSCYVCVCIINVECNHRQLCKIPITVTAIKCVATNGEFKFPKIPRRKDS